jgi:hypothetical protein
MTSPSAVNETTSEASVVGGIGALDAASGGAGQAERWGYPMAWHSCQLQGALPLSFLRRPCCDLQEAFALMAGTIKGRRFGNGSAVFGQSQQIDDKPTVNRSRTEEGVLRTHN